MNIRQYGQTNYLESMRIFSFILFFWSLGMFAQQNNFTSVSLKSSASQLTEKMESAKSLYGEFEQTKVIKMLDVETTSYGRIYYQSPDVIKWEYTKPYPYSLLFKNNFIYIDDDGQKSKQDMMDTTLCRIVRTEGPKNASADYKSVPINESFGVLDRYFLLSGK